MGIGQIQILHYRSKEVEYLPYMNLYEFIWIHKKPEPITSYETIILPFDHYVWAFTIGSTIFAFTTLILMQKIHSHASGHNDPLDYVHQGNVYKTFRDFFARILEYQIQNESSYPLSTIN